MKRYRVNIGYNYDCTINWYYTDSLQSAKIKATKSTYFGGFNGMVALTPIVEDTYTASVYLKDRKGWFMHDGAMWADD